jgi:hypothetical protein
VWRKTLESRALPEVGRDLASDRGDATESEALSKLGEAQRQEGSDAGDGERLHERSNALKGITPRADPA